MKVNSKKNQDTRLPYVHPQIEIFTMEIETNFLVTGSGNDYGEGESYSYVLPPHDNPGNKNA